MSNHNFIGHHGWLTGRSIESEVGYGRIIIEPFSLSLLNPNSYNYRLAPRLLRITNDVIDFKKPDEFEEIFISEEGAVLQPGDCYLGATIETLGSPFFPSLITGRSSVGRKFVTNHVTAGLLDIGFIGSVTLEITVQKPTRVYAGIAFGQIFWFSPVGYSDAYDGKYVDQSEAVPSR